MGNGSRNEIICTSNVCRNMSCKYNKRKNYIALDVSFKEYPELKFKNFVDCKQFKR